MRERSKRLLDAHQRNLISKDELASNLFDSFIHASTHGLSEHFGAGLDSLPPAVLADLLAYARAHPEPRVFDPQSSDPERRCAEEQAALAAQADLVARLQQMSR